MDYKKFDFGVTFILVLMWAAVIALLKYASSFCTNPEQAFCLSLALWLGCNVYIGLVQGAKMNTHILMTILAIGVIATPIVAPIAYAVARIATNI